VRRRVQPRWTLRGVLLVALLLVVAPGRALAADAVSLRAGPNPVRYGARVALAGQIAPAAPGESVGIYAQSGRGWKLVASVVTDAAGAFSRKLIARGHGVFVARTTDALGNPVESPPVSVVVRPAIYTLLHGSRRIGARVR